MLPARFGRHLARKEQPEVALLENTKPRPTHHITLTTTRRPCRPHGAEAGFDGDRRGARRSSSG
jgi:hypothetical protein